MGGSPGGQILHCIGPFPSALWPSRSSPFSWRWNLVCDRSPALPRSSSETTFQTLLMGRALNHAGVGQRARVGGGPHWARLDLGVQVRPLGKCSHVFLGRGHLHRHPPAGMDFCPTAFLLVHPPPGKGREGGGEGEDGEGGGGEREGGVKARLKI